jgi:hypothetical protein
LAHNTTQNCTIVAALYRLPARLLLVF